MSRALPSNVPPVGCYISILCLSFCISTFVERRRRSQLSLIPSSSVHLFSSDILAGEMADPNVLDWSTYEITIRVQNINATSGPWYTDHLSLPPIPQHNRNAGVRCPRFDPSSSLDNRARHTFLTRTRLLEHWDGWCSRLRHRWSRHPRVVHLVQRLQQERRGREWSKSRRCVKCTQVSSNEFVIIFRPICWKIEGA